MEIMKMRYFSFLMFLMLGVYAFAQKDVTQFLGIPVDGTKTEMVQKLKAKGFKYNSTYDWLEGEFNGREVVLLIATNNNKVWRVAVRDKWTMDETNIKIRYNDLCRQFAKNEKYCSLNDNPLLSEEENIGYEMLVNNKRYESAYFQSPKTISALSEEERQEMLSATGLHEKDLDSLSAKSLDDLTDLFVGYLGENYWSKKMVWFMIGGEGVEYRIVIFYDNEYNHADGEDL